MESKLVNGQGMIILSTPVERIAAGIMNYPPQYHAQFEDDYLSQLGPFDSLAEAEEEKERIQEYIRQAKKPDSHEFELRWSW